MRSNREYDEFFNRLLLTQRYVAGVAWKLHGPEWSAANVIVWPDPGNKRTSNILVDRTYSPIYPMEGVAAIGFLVRQLFPEFFRAALSIEHDAQPLSLIQIPNRRR